MNEKDFVICLRDIKNGKFDEEPHEPGSTRFLLVPAGNADPSPADEVPQDKWEDAIFGLLPADPTTPGDILVFIHGYNSDQTIIMQKHRQLKKDIRNLGFVGVVVSFDWPSEDKTLAYLADRRNARMTALQLVTDCIEILARRQRGGCVANVHLLAHSTGAYVIREAFDDADDNDQIAKTNWTVSQIVLIAGDIASATLGKSDSKGEHIYRHCIRLTNYWNPYDSVLSLSNVKRGGVAPRVGRVGLPNDRPDKAVDIDCGPYFQILVESARKAAGTLYGTFCHSWHIGDPIFTEDLYLTLQGDVDRNYFKTRIAKDENDLLLTDPSQAVANAYRARLV